MGDTTLATFRVDKDTWKEFKEWASERGSNASTELNQFILRSLGRIDNNLDTDIDSRDNRIDKDIDKRIENYLDSNLDERIEATVKRYLDDNLEQQMYEATLKSIDRNIDKNIDNNIDKNIDTETETSLDTNIDGSLDKDKSIDIDIDNPIDKEATTLDEETTVTESVGEEKVTEQLADEKGLSGKELASLLGVRPEYLTRWKSGRNIPKEDSENYQAYENFCKYRWEKKKGTNQAKYYQVVHSEN